MTHPYLTALVLTFALGITMAWAESDSNQALAEQTSEEALETLVVLRRNLSDGEPRSLSRREWEQFDRIESRFQRLLADVDDVRALHPDRKVEIFNLQEELGALLIEGSHDDRIICTRTRRTGSRIPQRDCMTQREHDLERQRVRSALDQVAPYWGSPAQGQSSRGTGGNQ